MTGQLYHDVIFATCWTNMLGRLAERELETCFKNDIMTSFMLE
jgi:hypothetical protein